jgi:putative endonuclease
MLFNNKTIFGNSRKKGAQFERQARLFLEDQGLTFLAANQSFRCGELDLVMQDRDILVFIEVRQRSDNRFGDAWESVSKQKQQRWVRAAEAWLNQQQKSLENCACRFDLVTFDSGKTTPDWFKHFIEFNH